MDEYVAKPEYDEYKQRIDERIHRSEKRIDQVEHDVRTLTELTTAVKEMAIHMEGVKEELAKQGERLEKIESEPADAWKTVKRTIVTVVITAVVTGVIAALINMI
ncbi:MAG: hypothetical protein IJ821_07305 [Lachnospiraceae bacterium]|nr:hypothetical protein [Lachnospiraceae bacterium]